MRKFLHLRVNSFGKNVYIYTNNGILEYAQFPLTINIGSNYEKIMFIINMEHCLCDKQ